ncbi:cytochrome p450 2u1 [Plakobranchus ocellatus]|uniref:Cytochrome p450 2u1 n=1 Tax=Plakobranchus ocellatus TaxID=259542 RepID=A0AAV3YSQ6_9GAST|nr:cytochrome p450 2u1 [Plakobranchus ocellatus]
MAPMRSINKVRVLPCNMLISHRSVLAIEHENVFHELSEVVGVERAPDLQDKTKLNYFWATVMETQRLASIVPQSLPHLCITDVTIQGYTIPAEAVVLPNLDAVMWDENTWEDPLKFRPERFLDDTGALIKSDSFIPFSVGQ